MSTGQALIGMSLVGGISGAGALVGGISGAGELVVGPWYGSGCLGVPFGVVDAGVALFIIAVLLVGGVLGGVSLVCVGRGVIVTRDVVCVVPAGGSGLGG